MEQVTSAEIWMAICQLFEVLDQALAAQGAALKLMLQAAKAFAEIELFKAVPVFTSLCAYAKHEGMKIKTGTSHIMLKS